MSIECDTNLEEVASNRAEKNYRQIYEKLEKWTERLLSNLHSFKLGEYNHLLSILTLRFINCAKFNFGKKLLANGFLHKHWNFWPLCLPVKMAPKTVIRCIVFIQKRQNTTGAKLHALFFKPNERWHCFFYIFYNHNLFVQNRAVKQVNDSFFFLSN